MSDHRTRIFVGRIVVFPDADVVGGRLRAVREDLDGAFFGAAVAKDKVIALCLRRALKDIERDFGRRRGQRWGDRVLDLDILLWSGGMWADSNPALSIPHPGLRSRGFVLTPAAMVAPDWRDPVSGLNIRHLQSRFNRPKALDQSPHRH